jgi:hypothetical protein
MRDTPKHGFHFLGRNVSCPTFTGYGPRVQSWVTDRNRPDDKRSMKVVRPLGVVKETGRGHLVHRATEQSGLTCWLYLGPSRSSRVYRKNQS